MIANITNRTLLCEQKNKAYFAQLKTNKPINLAKVAKSAGIPLDTMQKLNPDHTHLSRTAKKSDTFLVPINKVQTVANNLKLKSI